MIIQIQTPISKTLKNFLQSETSGGVLLIISAAIALLVANSPFSSWYFHIIHFDTGIVLNPKLGSMTTHLWINDGLMAIFFLLIGLEIKREFTIGHLAQWKDRLLPVIAASGGMGVPALVYLVATSTDPSLARGWAIPAATDIAFAIAVLALAGDRVPLSLKLFLTTVAIVDDMGAIAIIAIAYTDSLNGWALLAALGIIVTLYAINRMKLSHPFFYYLGFVLLWYAILLSGVHATIAGVLTALLVPVMGLNAQTSPTSPLHRMENQLHKPVALLVVPLFGLVNAGVPLADAHLLSTLPLAIALALFIGKQVGIFGSVWLAVKLKLADQPASWIKVYGVALICGIGFTMSLFIGDLAFDSPVLLSQAKQGILIGSALSAGLGYLVLRLSAKPQEL